MTLNLIMTPDMILVYSYIAVGLMALGVFPILRLSDLVRLTVVIPLLLTLAGN
jgi:hypothetical protein